MSSQLALVLGVLLAAQAAFSAPRVVINEIHYNPDVKIEQVEFIEIYNTTTNTVDISGWQFTEGVHFTFPANTLIAPNGFKVIAQNPAALLAKFAYAGALGPYSDGLSKYGETITLKNAQGGTENSVSYQIGFPWPTVGDPPGYSIELINPNLDNDLGGSWRASVGTGNTNRISTVLVPDHSQWNYRKGTNEASNPTSLWRQLNFNDSNWGVSSAPFGYGENFIVTTLSDMRSNYVSVFFRKKFVINDLSQAGSLLLDMQIDDGAKVWINGSNVLNVNISSGEVAYNGTASATVEALTFSQYVLINPSAYLVAGTNIIAIQAHNSALSSSSDFVMDARLTMVSGPLGIGPTPGRTNVSFANNAPPQIRQVDNSPSQPRGGDVVKITAKITDPDGVTNVVLEYQVVDPGNYIQLTDAAYATNWTSVAMNDTGTKGDVTGYDDVYSVNLPNTLQLHRRLIRYRITATDSGGRSIRVPYADDPQPNFAYFVYDGVPEWSGAVQPGISGTNGFRFTVSSNEMNRLPVYQLIASSNSFATAIGWAPGATNNKYLGDDYLWKGTLVLDGKVYDHVGFRARGGIWRYSMGKNAMKFALNRGHDLEVTDNWGRKLNTPWRRLSFRPNIQQGDSLHRGEQGMFESVGYRMFGLAGVPSPEAIQIQFRVIDDARETVANNQYEGDFYGLWLAVEEQDGRFLEERKMPDGNIYDMESWTGTLNHMGLLGPTDKSDLNYFINTYSNTTPTEAWWRTNLDLRSYYGYQTIIQGIHHYDISAGKNYFYYRNPENRLWQPWPWDLDLTWANNVGGGVQTGGDEPFKYKVLSGFADPGSSIYPAISVEFRNRVREIRDLFYNNDEAFRVVDEQWWMTHGTNTWSITDADRALWDYNPVMSNGFVVIVSKSSYHFYQWQNEPGTSNTFGGAAQLMKNYINYRSTDPSFSLDTMSADAFRPKRPTINYTGTGNYPINRLTFHTSNYSGTNAFAAIQWRIAEITSPTAPLFHPDERWPYEISSVWEITNTVFLSDITIPSQGLKAGHRYRVRARMKDSTGRASNWSLPVEFALGEPDGSADLLNYLRISEIMYNPPAGGYEYVELHNSSPDVTLDLGGVKFTQGIDYTFPVGSTLAPNSYLLVIGTTSIAAFRAYYSVPANVPVYAAYTGALNNGGELLTLRTSAGGTDIVSFNFRDTRGWPITADGLGHSLVFSDLAESAQGGNAGEYGGNWRSSTYLRGSAGRSESIAAPSILLNEIVANTDSTNGISNDWIELYNPTDNPITLGPGWFLSDDGSALTKWQMPVGTVIDAHGWVSFDENTGFHNPTNIGFGLSKSGEQVFLSYLAGTPEDRIVDSVSFKAQEIDSSLGRYPDGAPFWFTLTPQTRGTNNAAPSPGVVISEIMYHPPDAGTNDNSLDEYIELWNSSDSPVSLYTANGNWRLNGEVDFTFPPIILGPGDYALAVSFDPHTNATQLAEFEYRYGIANPYLAIVGPYSGKLANSSARVALEKPQAPDVVGGAVSWAIVDEVLYSDSTPWPCGSDGTGSSLHRFSATAHGSDPSNWIADRPSAGGPRPEQPLDLPTIMVPPVSRIIPTNVTITFSVGVCGPPPFTYQWLFDNEEMAGATNATLTVFNAQLSDSGQYRVLVTNAAGSILSDYATLIVQMPPTILMHPESITVVGYTTAAFSVLGEGTAPLQYQWRFNGVDLPGQTNSTLLLTNVQLSQAGNYSARVFNTAGSALSSNAVLTVNPPPGILSQPSSVSANPGTTVVFSVSATGSGPLSYQWFHEGANIDHATSSTLTLSNVQLPDGGDYTVVVTDLIGPTVSQPATLTVLVTASYLVQPHSRTVLEGQGVSFTAIATGAPPIRFRWIKNGLPFLTNDTGVLTFDNVLLANAATYRVAITNIMTGTSGLSSSNFSLTVLADSDRDGLPDVWEQTYGLNPTNAADALIDLDGDGMIDRDEYIAGTDPRDPASFLGLSTPLLLGDTNGVVLQFNAVSNRTYTLQINLGMTASGWTNLASFDASSTNVTVRFTNSLPVDASQQFFRLVTPRLP